MAVKKMASGTSNLKEDFQQVSYKRSSFKKPQKLPQPHPEDNHEFDKSCVLRKVLSAKDDLRSSDLYASVAASLREGLGILNHQVVKKIVCIGLGRFGECMVSRYQLALLCCFKDLYNVPVKVYDPIFDKNHITVLEELGFEILSENAEGKYKISESEGLTLFYLPHCPKQLTNNLLWANWSLQLSNCMIISNSFNKVVEVSTKKQVNANAGFIFSILPYVVELAIINAFKYFEIFSDTAIHIFPLQQICLLPDDFWRHAQEPNYEDDVEFITNKCGKALSLA